MFQWLGQVGTLSRDKVRVANPFKTVYDVVWCTVNNEIDSDHHRLEDGRSRRHFVRTGSFWSMVFIPILQPYIRISFSRILLNNWYHIRGGAQPMKPPQVLNPKAEYSWKYTDPGQLIKAGIYRKESLDFLRHEIMFLSERTDITSIPEITSKRYLSASLYIDDDDTLHY